MINSFFCGFPLSSYLRFLLLTLTIVFTGTLQSAVLDFVEAEATVGGLHDIVISPDGNFVYAYELHPQEHSKINIYSRNATNGELAFISATQVLDGTTEFFLLRGLGISPDGNHLYAVGSIDDPSGTGIFWFDRDSVSGQLTYSGRLIATGTNSDFRGLGNPSGTIAFSPDGFFVYAGDIGGSGAIVTFQRAGNGVLTWLDTIYDDLDDNTLASITDIQISPDGNSLYAVSLQGDCLYAFSRDLTTGLLTMTQHFNSDTRDPENGIPGLDDSEQTVISRDGRFLYSVGNIDHDPGTGNDDQYNVVTFQRETTNGMLTYLSNTTNTVLHGSNPEYETLYWPTTVILSPDTEQRFLYTGSQISDAINVFRRDPQDGSLRWVGWVTDGVDEVALDSVQQITISPDGHFIYAANGNGGDVAVFDTRADLSLVKTDDIDPIQPSQTLTYTLAVTNNGPADAQNIVITDTLPTGVSYISGTVNMPGGACSENDGTVTCTLSSLAATAAATATLEVTVPANEGVISNTATVSADQLETTTDNDSDSEETSVSMSGSSNPTDDDSDDGGGGGGSADPVSLLLISTLLPLLRRRLTRKFHPSTHHYRQ